MSTLATEWKELPEAGPDVIPGRELVLGSVTQMVCSEISEASG